jgi:predicted nucleotidyltransferase
MTLTYDGSPEAEARVRSDLDRIVEAVQKESAGDPLVAVLLLGGYARGEGAVVGMQDGTLRGFNDYDFLLVFRERPRRPDRFRHLSRRLAEELEIDFVDLGIAGLEDLDRARPTLFWYELGEVHRVLWRREGTSISVRRFPSDAIDREEGSRLLVNRGLALLWAGKRLWPEGPGEGPAVADPRTLRFAAIASHKAVLAGGDAALLEAGRYTPSQEARSEALDREPRLIEAWAPAGFLEAHRRAAAFRRAPSILPPEGVGALWREARLFHEAAFRASEEARLGRRFGTWTEYAPILSTRVRVQRFGTPVRVLRFMKRCVLPEESADGIEARFSPMARLLYFPGPAPTAPGKWTKDVERVVASWHP